MNVLWSPAVVVNAASGLVMLGRGLAPDEAARIESEAAAGAADPRA